MGLLDIRLGTIVKVRDRNRIKTRNRTLAGIGALITGMIGYLIIINKNILNLSINIKIEGTNRYRYRCRMLKIRIRIRIESRK